MKLEKGIGIVESFDAKVFFCCFSTSDILPTLWIDCLVRIGHFIRLSNALTHETSASFVSDKEFVENVQGPSV